MVSSGVKRGIAETGISSSQRASHEDWIGRVNVEISCYFMCFEQAEKRGRSCWRLMFCYVVILKSLGIVV